MELRGHMGAPEFIDKLRKQTNWPLTDIEMMPLIEFPERPLLISPEQTTLIVSGPPGSGKSTIAKILASQLGFDHLNTDGIRIENPTGSLSFDDEATRRVYHYLIKKAVVSLLDTEQPRGVVLDGTFPSAILGDTHSFLTQLTGGVTPVVINVLASAETAWRRMNNRVRKWLTMEEGRGYQPAVSEHFIRSVIGWGELATRMQSATVNILRPLDHFDCFLYPDSVIEFYVRTQILPLYFQLPE